MDECAIGRNYTIENLTELVRLTPSCRLEEQPEQLKHQPGKAIDNGLRLFSCCEV